MRPTALVIVPFEPGSARLLDATLRRTLGAHLDLPLRSAFSELEAALGHRFTEPPRFGAARLARGAHRSLTAITLASALERAGLGWRVLDPGAVELAEWRRMFAEARGVSPAFVGISTTFITSRPWLEALIALARAAFPRAKLAVGGYYYTTDAEGFLSLDADVFCIGEGERRLPELVRRVFAGSSLADVPGLYLAEPSGERRSTGKAEPLALDALPAPDWRLAPRIEPPVALSALDYLGIETQRGCGFMCAFCTYRTLAVPSAMSAATAAERILALPRGSRGYVELYDATATSPKRRFHELVEIVAARSHAPIPMGVFARVSDLDAELVASMTRAGVRHLYIGQESGDQRLLNAMRKGTRIEQVEPAVELAARHGLSLTFGLIHGFPGEDRESLDATRELLVRVNRRHVERPPVFAYDLTPFALQDFAAVSTDPLLRRDQHHFLGYRLDGMSVADVCREILRTIVATSRVPHAPIAQLVFQRGLALPSSVMAVSPERAALFRWAKALERGVAIFVERELDGAPPDRHELDSLKRVLLEPFGPARESMRERTRALVERALFARIQHEWRVESESGPGFLTRLALWRSVRRAPPSRPSALGPSAEAGARELVHAVDRRFRRPRSWWAKVGE